MYTICSDYVVFMYWTGKSMNNLLSYLGLLDPRISASDKDLPVPVYVWTSQSKIVKTVARKSLIYQFHKEF